MTNKKLVSSWRGRLFEAGITQEELSKNLSISITSLNKILTGAVKNPKMLTVDEIESTIKRFENA